MGAHHEDGRTRQLPEGKGEMGTERFPGQAKGVSADRSKASGSMLLCVLYSARSRERSKNQNKSTRCHDAAFDEKLDAIAGSPAAGKYAAGIIDLFVDDLLEQVQPKIEIEQRGMNRLRKDFQVGSEDWNDVTFTGQRIR